MGALDFYFDFVCPYAYVASKTLEGLERAGHTVTWCPILLGGVFRAIGGPDDPNQTKGPAKARYGSLDLERTARDHGVSLCRPAGHPRRTVLALRATLASGNVVVAARALFAAYWQEGLDLEDPKVVASSLDGVGLDGAAAIAAAETEAIKQLLRQRTEQAVARGIFGVPTFAVGAELYWGVDRLDHVKAALLPQAYLSFYFDYSSPYAYLGATQVRALAARTRATIDYQPILLGGLFRSIGTPNVPLFEMPEAKRNYLAQELPRFAERFGVPFRFTSHFPMNTVKALRLTLAADNKVKPALIEALFRALWVEDRDISNLAELAAIAKSCDAIEALARIEEPDIKAALHTSTSAAIDYGIFGVPSLVIEGQLYWGQDRLAQAEAALMARRS